ncbi:hypothetical protein [Bacillus subtilis]
MMEDRNAVESALFNYPIKEIRHQYGTLVLILNGGYEVEISPTTDDLDESILGLNIELFKNERTKKGGYAI